MPHQTQAAAAAAPRSAGEIEHIVVMERLHRYNQGLPCGTLALRRHLREEIGLHPLPSVRHIRQILAQYGLTDGRTGWYEGEKPDGLPGSGHIPESQHKHLPMTAARQR